eukprot:gb/GFBE01044763.1/.p1 GENE.gb/GFBE01044763.1/~~gb/GFBE01044763.1/.p1  ORF type:complete len:330 (+),score=68.93 gb/GFBE01044763.1/:1-990(+)
MATTVFSVCFPSGDPFDVSVAGDAAVRSLREEIARVHEVPPACNLKLFQEGQLLNNDMKVSSLDPEASLFAVIARETELQVLLQEAGSFDGYHRLLDVAGEAEGAAKSVEEVPSILQVLEEMSGEPRQVDQLAAGKDGTLEFLGADGTLLLPSLDAGALLKKAGVEKFASVTMTVELNSDAYNRGLGVVVEAPPVMHDNIDESGLPAYAYNGYGLSDDKISNAIKFHPGMRGGQIRVEGVGGWGNTTMNFTPANWSNSGNKLHTFELTVRPDGNNMLVVKGTGDGERFERSWVHTLTNGRHLPAIHAWLDLGGPQPLVIGKIGFTVQLA